MDDQVLVFKQSHVFKPIPLCQGYLKQTGCATWRFLLRLLGNILAGISGANSQIIPCPGPRNQSTPHEGTAQGFWSLCLLKRKARLFHPLHAIAILSHNQQNNLQTVWLLHTICLGKKRQGYAHLARWRQTQKAGNSQSPTGCVCAFCPYYCPWIGCQARLLLRINQSSLSADEGQSSVWTLRCLIQTHTTSPGLGLFRQTYSGSPSWDASQLGWATDTCTAFFTKRGMYLLKRVHGIF